MQLKLRMCINTFAYWSCIWASVWCGKDLRYRCWEENDASACRIEDCNKVLFHSLSAPRNRIWLNVKLPCKLKTQCLHNNTVLFVQTYLVVLNRLWDQLKVSNIELQLSLCTSWRHMGEWKVLPPFTLNFCTSCTKRTSPPWENLQILIE